MRVLGAKQRVLVPVKTQDVSVSQHFSWEYFTVSNPEYKEQMIVKWYMICVCLWDRDRQDKTRDNKKVKREHKWERARSRYHADRKVRTVAQTFSCPAKKCPNSLFAASAPPLWATSKINGDHYRSHATQTLLVQASRSSLTPAPQTL